MHQLSSIFGYFYWVIREIWHLSWDLLIVYVAMAQLSVISTAKGVQVSILANEQSVITTTSYFYTFYVFF